MNENPSNSMSFLEHLEELRWHLIRSVAAILVVMITVFIAKNFVFDYIVMAPKNLGFITYKVLCWLSDKFHLGDNLCINAISFTVTNIDMAGQFLIHLKVSFILGFVFSFPYVFWEIWRFVKPALYEQEVKYTTGIVFFCSLLFLLGVLFGYFIIVPFSINFLGSYQVSEEVSNTINLSSYVTLISMLVLAAGIIFELPMLVYVLSKIGLVTPAYMRAYRKHAFVAILVVSAIITPPDVTSQVLITIPLIILYEISIFISAKVYKAP